jgi:hypothetical protein
MRTIEAIGLAALLMFSSCATQPSVAPGPLGEAQTKLAEARSITKSTETRITDYFEAAEIAEQEAESQSHDAATRQQAKQIYNDACAEGTVLLEEADGANTGITVSALAGYACPITTTLDFSPRQSAKGGTRVVIIALHDPTLQQTVRLGTTTYPLAYDLSAPLGHYPRANAA